MQTTIDMRKVQPMKRWISVLLVVALLCAMPGTAVAYEFDTEEALDIPGGIALELEVPDASPEE